MALLSDYLYLTRQLLRDANARFFTDQFLTICINQARDKVVMDTCCTRTLPLVSLVPGQEIYTYQTILAAALLQVPAPSARSISTILNISFIQTQTLSPVLRRMDWSEFNRRYRTGSTTSFPIAWAPFDLANQIFIQPVIGQTGYQIEVDCVWLPTNLSNASPNETAIPDPVTELVPYWSSFIATQYEQDQTRAAGFIQSYELQKTYMLASMPPFTLLNRYQ